MLHMEKKLSQDLQLIVHRFAYLLADLLTIQA